MDWKLDESYQMLCGSAIAESQIYRLYRGKSGKRWLVADNVPNQGEYVYVEGGPNSDGFGGRTLQFPLIEGKIVSLKGPWHSNSNALFEDTGVDVRDKHLTFGCVSKSFKSDPDNWMGGFFIDVIHLDKEPTLGPFKRVDHIAQEYADRTGESCYCYSKSLGGSHRGPVNPTKK